MARARAIPLDAPFEKVPVTTDWRALADEQPALDGVILVTPPATHLDMARYFVGKGLPVLVEKPLCLDENDAVRFEAQVRAARAIAWVDHTHLFHPAFRALKQHCPPGSIERIVSRGWNRGPVRQDVPMFWDWTPHDVAMILDLLGEEEPGRIVTQDLEGFAAETGREATAALELTFPSGAQTRSVTSNMRSPKTKIFCVKTSTAWYRYNPLELHALTELPVHTLEEDVWEAKGDPLPYEKGEPLEVLLREFCEAIGRHDTGNDSLALGVRVVRILSAAWRSMV